MTSMTSTNRVWMTRRAYIKLQAELAELRAKHRSEVSDDATDDDATRTAEDRMRSNRIHRIEDLLANAVVGENPPDDGVAEPGMVLTIRYDDTGVTPRRSCSGSAVSNPPRSRSTRRGRRWASRSSAHDRGIGVRMRPPPVRSYE
ncbi:transcription elongation factor [Mycolicibacterium flavescens]|nr:transcription elongation factor [Mycolicibacterium flavescens]